jgi:hypothetical protein
LFHVTVFSSQGALSGCADQRQMRLYLEYHLKTARRTFLPAGMAEVSHLKSTRLRADAASSAVFLIMPKSISGASPKAVSAAALSTCASALALSSSNGYARWSLHLGHSQCDGVLPQRPQLVYW